MEVTEVTEAAGLMEVLAVEMLWPLLVLLSVRRLAEATEVTEVTAVQTLWPPLLVLSVLV